MQSVQTLLTTAGVNTTGWTLTTATGVSADGSVIVGDGTHGTTTEAWLARFAPLDSDGSQSGGGSSFPTGFITTGVVAQSFAGQAAIGGTFGITAISRIQ